MLRDSAVLQISKPDSPARKAKNAFVTQVGALRCSAQNLDALAMDADCNAATYALACIARDAVMRLSHVLATGQEVQS